MRVWMDQGGTFTDVVTVDDDGVATVRKVLTDRADLAALGAGAREVRRGTTAATNALLERQGAPVLLVTTAGFADLPWLGDQTRPALFSPGLGRPPPLCQRVLEVSGRIDAAGRVLTPHDVSVEVLRGLRAEGLVAVAVAFVFGPLAPDEERRVGEICFEAGFKAVTLGHEVAPSRGFLARMQTAVADAALSPVLPRAAGAWMRSDGGLATGAEWRGCHAVLSGPAGGVTATAALARSAGVGPAFGFDMGGTSTDVCRVDGEPERTDHLTIDGMTLRVPAVRLETVAAGGGSRLAVRAAVYAVGPRSAGADPGPAAYGRGGPATLTDVEVALGRLPAFPAVCGPGRDAPLDAGAARDALAALDLERPIEQVADGFRAVADETMAQAIARLAAAQGVDPAAHALVAFGGAGPAHACAVARRLGVRTVLVPRLAGVLSAVGIGLARRRAERVAPVRETIGAALGAAIAALPFAGEVSARLALRARGTSEAIEVPLDPVADRAVGRDPSLAHLAAFRAAHRRRFGFDRADPAVEVVEVRVSVEEPADPRPLRLVGSPASAPREARAWFDGWRDVPVADIGAAHGLVGPALIVGDGTTVVVEPGWRVTAADDHLRLDDEGAPPARLGVAFDAVQTAVVGHRLTAIAEQMGERLQRLARSINIRERRDFSCAVFDADGRLVVNAPHIPVHLGAMGETVRDLLRTRGAAVREGTVWVCNDPYAGGSHLPDITVMMPVFRRGARVAFVACRGHHVDVGGVTPGSMPPFARTLDEEGLVLRHALLAEQGRLLPVALPGCREPDVVRADLEAQVAACAAGDAAVRALGAAIGDAVLAAHMGHLRGVAARAARGLLRRLGDGVFESTEDIDVGIEFVLKMEITDTHARLILRAPPDGGNRNAPRAVAVAALLYALRCLVDEPIPLNEGALDPIALDIEPGGLFDPQPPRAVAGGNVETSQRLVDALLRAVGAQAAGQGTMNNLTVGTAAGSWYETIGGGGGAGPGFDGVTGAQVHMTNTRATDVEELESRFPVRLDRVSIRAGSGGAGARRGGDGVVKEWTFLAPAEVALLAGRRDAGAPGLAGGGPGLPGVDERDVGRGWEPAPPQWAARAGDRVRIATPGGGGWGVP